MGIKKLANAKPAPETGSGDEPTLKVLSEHEDSERKTMTGVMTVKGPNPPSKEEIVEMLKAQGVIPEDVELERVEMVNLTSPEAMLAHLDNPEALESIKGMLKAIGAPVEGISDERLKQAMGKAMAQIKAEGIPEGLDMSMGILEVTKHKAKADPYPAGSLRNKLRELGVDSQEHDGEVWKSREEVIRLLDADAIEEPADPAKAMFIRAFNCLHQAQHRLALPMFDVGEALDVLRACGANLKGSEKQEFEAFMESMAEVARAVNKASAIMCRVAHGIAGAGIPLRDNTTIH